MRFLSVLLSLLIPFLVFADEEDELLPSTPSQLASLNCEPSHLIGGLISPLSGHLCLKKTDLMIKGAQNIVLTRVYIPPHMHCSFAPQKEYDALFLNWYLSKNYRGWQFLPHLRVHYNPTLKEVRLTSSHGATIDYQISDSKTTLALPHYAINNVCGDEPSGKYDPRNVRIVFEGRKIIVSTPEGGIRHYENSLLQKEILPNGKVLRYKYNEQGRPIYVESMDPKERFVYASLSISGYPKEGKCHFTSSSGQTSDYRYQIKKSRIEIKEKAGKGTHTEVWDVQNAPLLTEVSSPFFRKETLDYCDRFLLCQYSGKDLFSAVHGAFDSFYKIQQLSFPFGAEQTLQAVYELNYQPPVPGEKEGWTEVKKCDGTKTLYHFSKDLLPITIQDYKVDLCREKIYTWTENHWLKSLEIRDKNTLTRKTYEYDVYGNPILEILTGDLTGEGIQEHLTLRREFSQDGCHLLLKEEHENGKILCFSYLPDTNLVTAKLTRVNDHIFLREFSVYDDCHNLIQTISDNGSGVDPNDLSDVTQRKINRIHLRQSPPFLHMPEWIEETYVDNGFEKPLQKKHLVYDSWGNVVKEDIYDANSEWAYTLHKEYNERGDLISETNPLGQKATYEYDPRGLRIKETNFSGRIQKNRRFDRKGRLLEENEIGDCGTSHKTQFEYDAKDRLIKKTDPLDHAVSYTYDPLVDKIIKTDFPDNITTNSTFDPFGRMLTQTDANGNTQHYRYNAYGSVTEIIYPDEKKECFRYTKEGFLSSHTNQEGLQINYSRDVLGKVLSKTYIFDQILAQEEFQYDGIHLIRKTDKGGFLTHILYDGAGRKQRENASGHIIDYRYDSLNRLSLICKHNGDNSLYIHTQRDFEGRIIEEKKTDHCGNLLYHICYTYDADGNKATTTKYINGQQSLHKYTYDAFGRLIESKDPGSFVTKYVYNEHHINSLGQRVLQTTAIDPYHVMTVETQDALNRTVKKEMFNLRFLDRRDPLHLIRLRYRKKVRVLRQNRRGKKKGQYYD